MRLHHHLPNPEFYNTASPHIKLYTEAHAESIHEVLATEELSSLQVQQVMSEQDVTKRLFLIRHFESNYNIYKKNIEENPLYRKFLAETNDEEQIILAQQLLKQYYDEVRIDYHTPLSAEGLQQAELYGKLYGELFSKPDLQPEKITISPYTRTKHTAHAILKNIQGLDIDIDFLLNNKDLTDMRIGELNGKEVVVSLSDQVRERDFGSLFGPWFLKQLGAPSTLQVPISTIEKEKQHYYTSTHGGESQDMVNQRAKHFLDSIRDNGRYKTRLVITHHLFILAILKNIFGGSFNTFHNLDTNRKPRNGSLTSLIQIPGGEDPYPTDRIRATGYNLYPTDEK